MKIQYSSILFAAHCSAKGQYTSRHDDLFAPGVSTYLEPVQSAHFDGTGIEAQYVRRYENGDRDEFSGFYAYREKLRDRSPLLAAPLYYPGVAWTASRIVAFQQPKRTPSR